ncbi:MAG: alpha/beta hydrolase [Burkholderiales bacterium]
MHSAPTQKLFIDGPAGKLETVINDPGAPRRAIALIAHPHPLFGGTLDNKVVQTLAKALVELGYVALRCNFRGVGESAGKFDEGRGESDDMLAVAAYARREFGDLPLLLAGFSFGAFVQARLMQKLSAQKLVLIAPAVGRFAVGTVPANTLVVHGEEDDVVPLAEVLNWVRPQQLPVVVVPGTGHFFHGRLTQLKQIVLDACRLS